MSKSKKNVIDPNDLLGKYGADITRLFCLFASPPEKDLEWNDDGVEGCYRFVNRVWRLADTCMEIGKEVVPCAKGAVPCAKEIVPCVKEIVPYTGALADLSNSDAKKLYTKANQTIKKVTEDIESSFHFNTAISAVMELVNTMYSIELSADHPSEVKAVAQFCIENIVLLLSPIVPHFAEELWEKMGNTPSIVDQKWPEYRKDALIADETLIVVQVNGKLRAKFSIDANSSDEIIRETALANEMVQKHIADKPIKKVIVVRNKLVNIVV